MHKSGVKVNILVELFGVTRQTIAKILQADGKIIKARLDKEKLQLIVSLYENNTPVTLIAELIGVSRPTVYNILNQTKRS